MEFREIIAISGQPGLFRFIAQGANGVIVEALATGKRMNATGSARVSALSEIALFTDRGDMPLDEVFETMKKHATKPDPKATPEGLKKYFAAVVKDYDRDRVHVSDMKKIASWFIALTEAGMTDFTVKEED